MKRIISAILILGMMLTMITAVSADEEKMATVEVLQFDREPDIDGVVSEAEWGTPTAKDVTINNEVTFAANANTGAKLSFTFWLRYTYDGFYIALTTPDTKPYNGFVDTSVANMWQGDCLQFRIDPDGCVYDQGRIYSADRNNWGADYAEVGMAMGKTGTTFAYRWFGLDEKNVDLSNSNGRYAIKNDGKTTTYEAFIPWEDLFKEARPHVGTSHGMTIGMLTSDGTDGYENWLEWGAGLFNGRTQKMYGSNRITYSEKTVFGGASLTDPDPDAGNTSMTEKAPDATGDYVFLDFEKFSGENQMTWDVEDGVGTVTFIGSDPYVTADFWKMYNASADDYKYIAVYMKSTAIADGRIYFTTSNVPAFEEGCSVDLYCNNDSANREQVVVADMTICESDWSGKIGNLRFDFINEDLDDINEQVMEVYAIGLYKNIADACEMKGVTLKEGTILPDASEYTGGDIGDVTDASTGEDSGDDTNTPAEDTTANANGTDATTASTTEQNGEKGNSNSTLIIIIVVAAVVVIGGVVAVVVVNKKKA